jgi:hypothetical protein
MHSELDRDRHFDAPACDVRLMIRPATCPICQKPVIAENGSLPKTFPFCSDRCRQVDFFRWFDGKYAIVENIDPELLDPELLEPGDKRPPAADD